jgi:hypothetical protein
MGTQTKYEVTVTGTEEKHWISRSGAHPYIIGGIVVRPPIEVGEGFSKAIVGIGEDKIELVTNTDNGTTFRVDTDKGEDGVQAIATRIGQVLNNPEVLSEVMAQVE